MSQNFPLSGYETTVVTRAELTDEAVKALMDKLAGVVSQFGGELVLSEDWGKRKLSYPIEKETRAQYNYMVYTGRGDVVHEIERNLRLQDHVMRFLTVNLAKEFNAEGFKVARAEAHANAKKREAEREARREEREAARRAFQEERGRRDDHHGHDASEE